MSVTGHTSAAAVLRIELGDDFTQIRPAADRLQKFLQQNGCTEQARMDCELILVEGCNNAIKHSRAKTLQAAVVVEVSVEQDAIELRITDHGPGFAWPETSNLPEPEKESGRGLYLIRALTDYSAYFRRADGNMLVLRKKRSAT
ncbi:MAG TPA: ATP-binding protein [Verrucomicrobiae bacterium]|nr:ATP-binding protein [Verrucomicrobiae bacterium]